MDQMFGFDYENLYNKGQLDAYIQHHIPVGGFLTAILENDLKQAVLQADSRNIRKIVTYVTYLYNNAPVRCWGSPEKVQAWLNGE